MKTYSMLTSLHKLAQAFVMHSSPTVFLSVVETIVCLLLFCGVGIIECLFNLLHYIINLVIVHKNENNNTENLSATTRNYPQPQIKR